MGYFKAFVNYTFFDFLVKFLMMWKVSSRCSPLYSPSFLSCLIALSMEACSSVMMHFGYPPIISKKLLKIPAKTSAV